MSTLEGLNRILVPWDFSDASEGALDWALKLSGASGATVVILHVGPSTTAFMSPFPDLAGFQMEAWQEARGRREEQAMARLDEAIESRGQRDNIELHYVEAEPAVAIQEAAREESADLIVMGTHGRDGVARAVFGSIAESVHRSADVPVLLVK